MPSARVDAPGNAPASAVHSGCDRRTCGRRLAPIGSGGGDQGARLPGRLAGSRRPPGRPRALSRGPAGGVSRRTWPGAGRAATVTMPGGPRFWAEMSTLSAAVASTEVTARERRAGILSVAAHLPDGILSNADLEAMVDTSDAWIMERTGIRLRHRAVAGETTSEMGV